MQTFNLDLSAKKVIPLLYAKQRDVGTKICVVLSEDQQEYNVPANTHFSVWYSGKSGEGNYDKIDGRSAFDIDGDTVTVELIYQMLNNPGEHVMCLVMNDENGNQTGLWNIPYFVEAIPGADSVAAQQYYQAFLQAQEKAEVAADRSEAAAKRAESVGVNNAVLFTPQTPTPEQQAQARDNLGISNDPDIHAKYFTITDNGIVSLKPEYRGACPSNRASAFPLAISDNGVGVNGSKNAELPKYLVIPEVVDEVAVCKLAPGMFMQNPAVETIVIPGTVTEIPDRFCDYAINLKHLHNTENILTVGSVVFQASQLEKAKFPKLQSIGAGAFNLCGLLVYADIGEVTALQLNTFNICSRLSRVKGDKVTTVGDSVFFANYNLNNADFLPNLTSIGNSAFQACRLKYDWASLQNCTFGNQSTALQLNPTDIWSGCTVTEVEHPVPTLLSQKDSRWENRQIGNSGVTYANGCTLISAMHAYCALNNLTLSTVEEFEAIINSKAPGILDSYDKTLPWVGQLYDSLGLQYEMYGSMTQATLQALYTGLAGGKYACMLFRDKYGSTGTHLVMVYGVNANGELLVADSLRPYDNYEVAVPAVGIKYAMPYQNMFDAGSDLIIVSK